MIDLDSLEYIRIGALDRPCHSFNMCKDLTIESNGSGILMRRSSEAGTHTDWLSLFYKPAKHNVQESGCFLCVIPRSSKPQIHRRWSVWLL